MARPKKNPDIDLEEDEELEVVEADEIIVDEDSNLVICSACNGTGIPTEPEFAGPDGKCLYCNGTGKVRVK